MKKLHYILLILCFMLLTAACGNINRRQKETVTFYYCRQTVSYDENGIIAEENRIMNAYDLNSILSEYLAGPHSQELTALFPQGTQVNNLEITDSTLTITLNKNCASMEELGLVLACSCLAKTVLPHTDADTVAVQADGGFTHMADPLIFTADSILTNDTVPDNS